jgi:DNA-directed RNA polymerase specialized sigma subunit
LHKPATFFIAATHFGATNENNWYLMKQMSQLEQATITNYYDDLLQQCKQGSTSGFKALYEKYVKAMFNTSLRIVAHATDAEDIVQEAFIDAFRNIDRFTYQSSFGAWLKRIVINKSIHHTCRIKRSFCSPLFDLCQQCSG